MSKKIIWPVAALGLLLLIALVFVFSGTAENPGKDFVIGEQGEPYYRYEDVTVELPGGFGGEGQRLTITSIEPESTLPLGLDKATAYEFHFDDLQEVKEGFRIFLPKTYETETPVGFLGIYELDEPVYYPIIGEVAEDEYFLFEVPKAALENSWVPEKTAQNGLFINKAHALDSLGGYFIRWLMPSGFLSTSTDNFRIFYHGDVGRDKVDLAAEELEREYDLYSNMGFRLGEQKQMGKINAYVTTSWDEKVDGKVAGKKFGDYELYKYIFIDGSKAEKRIRDTAAHELFHVAQTPYKLPLWLEEASATYMEKYSSAYKDYPVVSKEYYDLLFFQGIRTVTKEVGEDHFGYGLSTYIKYMMDRVEPKNDGAALYDLFESSKGRDIKTVIFDEPMGLRKEWITDYYLNFIKETIYPYGGAADILNSFKKDTKEYSLFAESDIGRALSFSDIEPYKPAMLEINFLNPEGVEGEGVGFYYKDVREQSDIELIMAVVEYISKEKGYKVALAEKLGKSGRVFLPKKYLSERKYKTYLVAVNVTNQPVKHYGFMLQNSLDGGNLFEDIEFMDATVSYSVTAVPAAQEAYKALFAKEPLTVPQRKAKWDANVLYAHITTAMTYNGNSYNGRAWVSYDKKRSTLKFTFGNDRHFETTGEDYDVGYLTGMQTAIFASVYKDTLVVQERGSKTHEVYGKGSFFQNDDGLITVDLDITRDIFGYRDHDKHGSMAMKIHLTGRPE